MAEKLSLHLTEHRHVLADCIAQDIDTLSEQMYEEDFRTHLGASQIGESCSRMLWYGFRWFSKPKVQSSKMSRGQLLRLFNRGDREEYMFTEYLKRLGFRLNNDPDNQIRISDVGEHFGGSLDNFGYFPEKYGIEDLILFEFKTAKDTEFNKLKKEGVRIHYPKHFAQMSTYGYKINAQYALYLCVNKNDDEIYPEVVQLDFDLGRMMIDKAAMIITSRQPPTKIAMTATAFQCKFCDFKNICHYDEAPIVNCRTCKHSVPADNKKWVCEKYGEIPDHIIPTGCQSYEALK